MLYVKNAEGTKMIPIGVMKKVEEEQKPKSPIFKIRNLGSMDTYVTYEPDSPQPDLTYEDVDGVRIYSNSFDSLSPFKEIIEGEFEDANGNIMINIPDIWVKAYDEEIDGVLTTKGFDLSSAEFEDAFLIPARAVGKYQGTNQSGALVSKTGVSPTFDKTIGDFRTDARANGAGYGQYDMHTWMILNLLQVVYFGTTNSDNYFADIHQDSASVNGTMNGYITAQMLSMGKNTFLGFENLIKNGYHFVDGANISNRNVWATNNPEEYVDNDVANYYNLGTTPTSNAYIIGYRITPRGMFPVSNGGNSGTYYSDYMYQISTTNRLLYVGSIWDSRANYGSWFWDGYRTFSDTRSAIGSRLVKTY